jgi:hypothetical protein
LHAWDVEDVRDDRVVSYGRSYYAGHEGNDVREKTVPVFRQFTFSAEEAVTIPLGADCCVCQMPMRDEKPCHWIGDEPMHKDCVGPSIVGVRKG